MGILMVANLELMKVDWTEASLGAPWVVSLDLKRGNKLAQKMAALLGLKMGQW